MRVCLCTSKPFSILALTLGILAAVLPSFSQSTAGRILGSVVAQSGAAVAGAEVLVTDLQRGTSRTLTTDNAGQYVVPNLPPSTYTVRVQAHGFKAIQRETVEVEVAKDVRLDFSLQPGQV